MKGDYRSKVSIRWISRKVFCFLPLLLGGCVEPYMPTMIVTDYNYLVVDGWLTANDSTFIKLSRTQTISDPNALEIEGQAAVQIEGENGKMYALIEKSNGLYVAPELPLDPTSMYRLRIKTNDAHEYLSDFAPIMSSGSLDSVVYEENRENDAIDFKIFAHNHESPSRYYLWTHDETWKYNSRGYSVYYYQDGEMIGRKSASEIYDCWKTVPNNNIYLHSTVPLSEDVVHDFLLFSIPQKSRKLYFGYSILLSQFALTGEAYDYWTLTKKNSESLGSLFDPLPAQALGNIRCTSHPEEPVIGYFSATTVQRSRVFFTRQDITGPVSAPYDPTGYEDCPYEVLELKDISDKRMQGWLVYDRVFNPITFELIGYGIGPAECVDCRLRGGTTQPPDYWR